MDEIILKLVNERTDAVIRKWLTATLDKQLAEQGVEDRAKLLEALVERLLSGEGGGDDFEWTGDDGKESDEPTVHHDLKMGLSPDDFREFKRLHRKAFDDLPGIIHETAHEVGKSLFKRLKSGWPERAAKGERLRTAFREALDSWWHEPLAQLRMLQFIAVELAQIEAKRIAKSRAKRNLAKRDVQFRLHLRICQVVDEIITLLESGFPDGAMARWRTLHEIVVVALLIYDHDDDLAERYLVFEDVEVYRAAELYQRIRVPLGDKPFSKRAMAALKADFDAAVARYEKSFGGHYGWAAHHLKKKAPSFEDLEEAAGRVDLRSHYKMASYNVHAGPRGIAFRLGAGDNQSANIAGASMYGLEEPGSKTAHALMQACMIFINGRKSIQEQVKGWSIIMLSDSAGRAFVKAGKAVRKAGREAEMEF